MVALTLLGLHEDSVGLLTAGFGAGAIIGSLGVSLLVGSSDFGRWVGISVALWGIPFVALAAVSGPRGRDRAVGHRGDGECDP